MIGLPNFDLTNQSGKQKFVEYIVNLMRNEIVAFTASYNDFEDESRSSLPDGLLVNNHRIGLDVNKPIAGDVTPGTYYTSTDINLGTTYRSDGIAWTQIAGSIGTAAIPVGTIIHTGQSTIPAGFIDCDGSSQLRSLYPTLFTAIGTTFGAGASPGTTFALPLVTGTYGNFVILADAPSVVVTTQTLIGAPIATLQLFAGSVYPTGYLRADGTAISRTSYADLFAVIGTTYGVGDGSTTFNLPNLLSSGSPSPVYIMKVSLSGTVEPSTVAHASSHIRAGTDVIDGDRVQIDYVPTNYTRDSTASGAGAVTDLTAHLAGIDTDKLRVGATAGGDLAGTYPNPTFKSGAAEDPIIWRPFNTAYNTEIGYSGAYNSSFTVTTNVPTNARYILADVFATANISDHINFEFGNASLSNAQSWVNTRGNQPSTQFGNIARNSVIVTYNGESDGYTPNYGMWYSSLTIPSSGRTIYMNNYGQSGSTGWIYLRVKAYSL